MAQGTIVNAWQDGTRAYLAVSVNDGMKDVNGNATVTEYIGTVPLADIQGLPAPQQKAKLVQAVIDARNSSRALAAQQTINMTGTVTV